MELVGGVVHLGDDVGHSARLREYLDLSRPSAKSKTSSIDLHSFLPTSPRPSGEPIFLLDSG